MAEPRLGLLSPPLRLEEAQKQRWETPGQPLRDLRPETMVPTARFATDPGARREGRPAWPRAEQPHAPIAIQMTRSAADDTNWTILIDGLQAVGGFVLEDERLPPSLTLPPPFSEAPEQPITSDTRVRPVVFGVHLGEGALAPQEVEIVVEQVVVSYDRAQEPDEDSETTRGDEVQELDRHSLQPFREDSLSAPSLLLPYPCQAPAAPTMGVISNQAEARWNRSNTAARLHNARVDFVNTARQGRYFFPTVRASELDREREATLRTDLLDSFGEASRGRLGPSMRGFSQSLWDYYTADTLSYLPPKQQLRRNMGPKPTAKTSTTVFGRGGQSSARELADLFAVLADVSNECMLATATVTRSVNGTALPRLNTDDATFEPADQDRNDQAEERFDAKTKKRLSLRKHLQLVRDRLVGMGEEKAVFLLEALLGATPNLYLQELLKDPRVARNWGYRTTLDVDESPEDEPDQAGEEDLGDAEPEGFPTVREAAVGRVERDEDVAQRLKESSTSYMSAFARNSYDFYFTNLAAETRARSLCKLRYTVRIREYGDDAWRVAVFESNAQDGVAAHAVLAGYPDDVRQLQQQSQRFIQSLKKAKEAQSLVSQLLASTNGLFNRWHRVTFGPSERTIDRTWKIRPETMEAMCLELVVRHHDIVPSWPPTRNNLELNNVLAESSRVNLRSKFKDAFDRLKTSLSGVAGAVEATPEGEEVRRQVEGENQSAGMENEFEGILMLGDQEEALQPSAVGLSYARLLRLELRDRPPVPGPAPVDILGDESGAVYTLRRAQLLVPKWNPPLIKVAMRTRFHIVAAPGKQFQYWDQARAALSVGAVLAAIGIGYGVYLPALQLLRSAAGLLQDATLAVNIADLFQNAGTTPSLSDLNTIFNGLNRYAARGSGAEANDPETVAARREVDPEYEPPPLYGTLTRADARQEFRGLAGFTVWTGFKTVGAINTLLGGLEEAYERTGAYTRDAGILNVIRGNPIASCVASARAAMKQVKAITLYDTKRPGLVFGDRRFCFFELWHLETPLLESLPVAPTRTDWERVPDMSIMRFAPPADVTTSIYESEMLRGLPFEAFIARVAGVSPSTTATTSPELSALFAYNEVLRACQEDRRPLYGKHLGTSAAEFAKQACEKAVNLLRLAFGPSSPALFVEDVDVMWSCLRAGPLARLLLRNLEVYKQALRDILGRPQVLADRERRLLEQLRVYQTWNEEQARHAERLVVRRQQEDYVDLEAEIRGAQARIQGDLRPEVRREITQNDLMPFLLQRQAMDEGEETPAYRAARAAVRAMEYSEDELQDQYRSLKDLGMADIYKLVWGVAQRQALEEFCKRLEKYAQEGIKGEISPLTLEKRVNHAVGALGRVNHMLHTFRQSNAWLASITVLYSHSHLLVYRNQDLFRGFVEEALNTLRRDGQPKLLQRTQPWTRHQLRIVWGSRRLNIESELEQPLDLLPRLNGDALVETPPDDSNLVKRMSALKVTPPYDGRDERSKPGLAVYFVPVGIRLVATGSSIEFGLGAMDQRLVQMDHLRWAHDTTTRSMTAACSDPVLVTLNPRTLEYGNTRDLEHWLERHPLTLSSVPAAVGRTIRVWMVKTSSGVTSLTEPTPFSFWQVGDAQWWDTLGRLWNREDFDPYIFGTFASQARTLAYNAERFFQALLLGASLVNDNSDLLHVELDATEDVALQETALVVGLAMLRAELPFVQLPDVCITGATAARLPPIPELLKSIDDFGAIEPFYAATLMEVCVALVASARP